MCGILHRWGCMIRSGLATRLMSCPWGNLHTLYLLEITTDVWRQETSKIHHCIGRCFFSRYTVKVKNILANGYVQIQHQKFTLNFTLDIELRNWSNKGKLHSLVQYQQSWEDGREEVLYYHTNPTDRTDLYAVMDFSGRQTLVSEKCVALHFHKVETVWSVLSSHYSSCVCGSLTCTTPEVTPTVTGNSRDTGFTRSHFIPLPHLLLLYQHYHCL